jgi:hypothetical protein
MMKLARSAFLAAVLAILAVAATIGTAVATRTINVPSSVSIHSNGLHFSGKVGTAKNGKPCRDQRRVILFKVISGGPDRKMGHDVTGVNGAWSVTPQGSAGITLAHFYAKAQKRSDGAAGTIHVCLPAVSKTIGVSP